MRRWHLLFAIILSQCTLGNDQQRGNSRWMCAVSVTATKTWGSVYHNYRLRIILTVPVCLLLLKQNYLIYRHLLWEMYYAMSYFRLCSYGGRNLHRSVNALSGTWYHFPLTPCIQEHTSFNKLLQTTSERLSKQILTYHQDPLWQPTFHSAVILIFIFLPTTFYNAI